ncbi:hypothetical protein BO85DRAFT_237671 [Aspergillus piperis CBS 112811]|uniref:Uncharacterized protein n=1 Tax=Aspergillus piperis CBS 112811 TaxID=1448313 RepID=A0A8G1R9L7_9EURO|nr:hypothetical protein BO85DRAFT_237671 [Aspergillus piperis CBS 112811]RAH60734.1 hypothetical protein BO85DRAFT_237671 [Aspergillus piperis CBS 112811]
MKKLKEKKEESSMGRGSPDSERANIRESFQASGDRLDSSGRVALDYNAIVQPELIGRLAIAHPSVRTSVPLFIAWRLSSIPPGPYKSKGLNGPPRFSLVVVQYLLVADCHLLVFFFTRSFLEAIASSLLSITLSALRMNHLLAVTIA